MIKLNLRAKMPLAPLFAMSLDKGAGAGVGPSGQSTFEHRNDFFDQYLNFDTVNVDNSLYLTTPESTLLVSAVKGFDSADTSLRLWKDEAGQSIPRRERGEPHQVQSAAAQSDKMEEDMFCFQDSCRAAGTEFELLSLEKISLQSPRLKPPLPSPETLINRKTRSRQRILDGSHKTLQGEQEIKAIRKSTSPIRKATSPIKMRRTQYTDQNIQNWGQQAISDAPNFDYTYQNTGTLSTPSSSRASESSDNNNRTMALPGQSDGAYAWDTTVTEQYVYRTTDDTESPLATPPVDGTSYRQSNMQNASSNNLMYANSNRDQSSNQWVQTSINQDYGFDESTSYMDDQDPPIWWANTATTPLTEPVPSAYRRQNQQNSQSLAMQLQAELTYNTNELSLNSSNMPSGLMIQMPNSPAGPYVVGATPTGQEQGYFTSTAPALPSQQPQQQHRYSDSQLQSYAPLPSTRHEKSHSHSQSHSHSHSQARKDSSPSPRPRATSRHSSKKHSSSRKRATDNQTGGQKSSKGSGTSPGLVADFVNFTPNDKAKILTGVAPSGSSKTKARREKEAAEKTKRLSQAAVRAVQAAGGSIDTLVEEGLFDDPELEELS